MDFSFGRDIAVMWLSLFCIIGLLVPMIALYFVIRVMNIAQRKSVELLQQGQTQVARLHQQTERVSAQAVQPILSAQSKITQVKATVKRVTRRK